MQLVKGIRYGVFRAYGLSQHDGSFVPRRICYSRYPGHCRQRPSRLQTAVAGGYRLRAARAPVSCRGLAAVVRDRARALQPRTGLLTCLARELCKLLEESVVGEAPWQELEELEGEHVLAGRMRTLCSARACSAARHRAPVLCLVPQSCN